MSVTVRMVVIGLCLSLVALLAGCGSGTSGTQSSPPSLTKTATMQAQVTTYGKALWPVLKADRALWAKIARVQREVGPTNAYSMAARIDDSYLPALQQIRTSLAGIKPPRGFGVAQARLEKVCAVQSAFLFFLRDALQRAVYTHTAEPGFATAAGRYIAQWKKAVRDYGVAIRAALKRSGVKIKPRHLSGGTLA